MTTRPPFEFDLRVSADKKRRKTGRRGMTGAFDFDLHALKRIAYIGVTFRTRTIEEIAQINARMRADLWESVTAGELRLPIAGRYPLERVEDALALMRENRHFGKIVLQMA